LKKCGSTAAGLLLRPIFSSWALAPLVASVKARAREARQALSLNERAIMEEIINSLLFKSSTPIIGACETEIRAARSNNA